MTQIDPLHFAGAHFNIKDGEKFKRAVDLLRESLFDGGATMFAADNVITWNRNLSFLRDDFFLDIVKDDNHTVIEKSVIWRLYILIHFAALAANARGDFLELGCHTGHSAAQMIKKIDFKKKKKKYYLYDLFEWNEGDVHTQMPGHSNKNMFEDTRARFAELPFVQVIKGPVPQSFSQGFPERVAFAHIDMNQPDPEAAALEAVLPRLSKGGAVVFDDYGWWGYSAQKKALDPIAHRHGHTILELPTGQGVLINI